MNKILKVSLIIIAVIFGIPILFLLLMFIFGMTMMIAADNNYDDTQCDGVYYFETNGIRYYGIKNNIIYLHSEDAFSRDICTPIESADSTTFISMGDNYAKDRNYVYFSGEIFEGTDSATFERISLYYSKDKDYVYYNKWKVADADPLTFQVLGYYAKDRNYVYYHNYRIDNADSETFESISTSYYAKDKNRYYYNGHTTSNQSIIDYIETYSSTD